MSIVIYPNVQNNYCIFDEKFLDKKIKQGKELLPEIKNSLEKNKNEDSVLENLYMLDKMLDNGVIEVKYLYPTLSKYNNTNSPNIQVYLAGIYRKIQVPDAFGPLCSMLIKNSIKNINTPNKYFDPNEEIGGAIISYLA